MRHLVRAAIAALSIALGAPALAATVVTLKPATGHPNLPVTVTGSGFGPSEAVDIYIDTVDTLLAVSSASGAITVSITIPAAAQPGFHYVTGIGRKSGNAAQKKFTVSTSWAQSGFGTAHLAWNQYENTLSPSVVPSLEQFWTVITGANGSPAVVAGTLYSASSDAQGIFAFNSATGASIWQKPAPGGTESFPSSPAVVGNVMYVLGVSGTLYAFNAANGTQLWSKALASPGNASPVVSNGVIYVGSGNTAYAVDTTGAIQWSIPTGGNIMSSGAIVNDRFYVGSMDKKLYCLSTGGSIFYSYTTGDQIVSSPAVANGVVYVASRDFTLYAVRGVAPTTRWGFTAAASFNGSPAVANGAVYITDINGDLYALDAAKGTTLWTDTVGPSVGPASVANGVVYVGDGNGNVNAVAAKTGEYLFAANTGGPVVGAPVVVNGILYVAGGNGITYAYEPGGPGGDAIRRTVGAPAVSSLRPDMSLRPVHEQRPSAPQAADEAVEM